MSKNTVTIDADVWATVQKNAERYLFLRDSLTHPLNDGSLWVVQYHHPAGTIPEMRAAGQGQQLDAALDTQIANQKSKEGT